MLKQGKERFLIQDIEKCLVQVIEDYRDNSRILEKNRVFFSPINPTI